MKHFSFYLLMLLSTVLLAACGGDSDDGGQGKTSTSVDEDDDETTANVDESYTYTLPVIFHVLYQDKSNDEQYVPQTRLAKILSNVNDLYAGQLYGESENIRVHFKMAEYDEDGRRLSTPGVEYVQYKGDYPIDPNDFMNDHSGTNRKLIWEPSEYINVMIYPFKTDSEAETIVLGITHMPYSVEGDNELEGLETVSRGPLTKQNLNYAHCASINSTYINNESTRYNRADHGQGGYSYTSLDVNVTVAHELGHYLGLYHIFTERKTDDGTEAVDDCEDTDYCDDTPSYNKPKYDEELDSYLEQHKNDKTIDIRAVALRTACDGTEFTSANLLDYAIGLGYKFSSDQKTRMRHVLYYSPLMPGPKKAAWATTSTRSAGSNEVMDLPVRTIKCTVRKVDGSIQKTNK